jgi:two-component sensor histidine kinase
VPGEDKARQGAIALAAALIAQQAGQRQEAAAEGEACAKLVREADASPRQAVECLAVAGRAYLAQGKLREAAARLAQARAAFAAAPAATDPAADADQLAIAELERDCVMKQAAQGDLPAILEAIQTYRKRIDSARSGAQIAVAAADMGQEGRDLSIALLEARNANLALRAQQQRYMIALAALVALIAGGAALLLWRAWRERIRLTASLAAALDHQATLSRDIRHRARNNLQLILSLLNLQWRATGGAAGQREPMPQPWEDLRRRIAAMGFVHSALYDEQDIDRPVELAPFLTGLGQAIATSYGREQDLAVEGLSPGVAIPCERAQPLGLLASELVANAFKHGGPGTVRMALQEEADGAMLSLTVSDQGAGFTPDTASRGSSGLDLVAQYVDQLRGSMALASTGTGTTWTVTFPARAGMRLR